MRSIVQLCFAANNILLMRNSIHALQFPELSAHRFPRIITRNKLSDRMTKQLLNSIIAKNRDLSVCGWVREVVSAKEKLLKQKIVRG